MRRDERRQPYLEREPVALGALARFNVKRQLTAAGVTQADVDNTVAASVIAHEASADPHTQYVAIDPNLRT